MTKRGIAVSAEENARIQACTDLEALDRWFDSALTVTTATDLFR